jgi:hypothetical protein
MGSLKVRFVIGLLVLLVGVLVFLMPDIVKAEEIKKDGRFIKYANGVVKDTKTELKWVAGPDRDTNWDEARAWGLSLKINGGGWRMPTIKELKTLYDKSKRKSAPFMTRLLKMTGFWVWSGETRALSCAYFDFAFGFSGWYSPGISRNLRAFAVRSR